VSGTITYRPRAFITDPAEGTVAVIRGSWWRVNATGEVAFYQTPDGYLAPQCSKHEGIVRRLAGDDRVEFIPLAFAPIRIEDYL